MNLDLRKIPAIYINLDKDVEKKERIESQLKELGFETIIRLSATYDSNSKRGCAISHAYALEEIDPPFIVFEDDCVVSDFKPIVEIPDDADAVYLGISSWGRMNGHSGPYVQYEHVKDDLYQTYNMLGGHAVLYLSDEYVRMCQRITYHAGYIIEDYQDIGFAEVQRWFNVYAFDDPFFYQTSGYHGTVNPLTSYPTEECFNFNKQYFLPERVV